MTGTITLTPTAEQANAMIQVRCNGGAYTNVTSGTVSAPLPVNMGANTLEVRVVSGNGLNVKTYSVMVTRRTGVKAQIVSPANGITLDNTWLTLTWRNGIGVTSYVLWVGTTAGGYDVYSGVETGTSRTVVAPAGKRTYVTLWSVINGV